MRNVAATSNQWKSWYTVQQEFSVSVKTLKEIVPFQQALVRISNLGVRVKMIDLVFRSLSRKKIRLLVFLGIRHRLYPKTSLRLRLRNPDFNNRLLADF